LEKQILEGIEHLTHELAQLNTTRGVNQSNVENLKVQVHKDSPVKARLAELAQVITRGRYINILLNEETVSRPSRPVSIFVLVNISIWSRAPRSKNLKQGNPQLTNLLQLVKPVKSAIQNSDLSLTPQGPTADAPTTLTLAIPPPTGESRAKAAEQATKVAEKVLGEIRQARGAQQKKMRAMQVAKTVRPDDLQKAHKLMEEVVQRGNSEVKRILDGAKRVIQG
jgi:ribosome recycling factor